MQQLGEMEAQLPPPGQHPSSQWTPAEIIAKRSELSSDIPKLNEHLGKGLLELLKDSDWYLTGIQVSLASMNSFCAVSDLVYRDFAHVSEGAWHLAHIKKISRMMEKFAQEHQNAQTRTQIMLEIRPSLAVMINAFEGFHLQTDDGPAQRTILALLAEDINHYVARERSFRKIEVALQEISEASGFPFKKKKLEMIEEFHRQNQGFANILGYTDPQELFDNKPAKAALARIVIERKKVENTIHKVRTAIFVDSAHVLSRTNPGEDLAAANIMPILSKISEAGFEFMKRAQTLYDHALRDDEDGVKLLEEIASIETAFNEFELRKITRKNIFQRRGVDVGG